MALPLFAKFAYADALVLLAQANEVHLGFQGHQEGTAVRNVQVEPQTCRDTQWLLENTERGEGQ